MAEGEKKGMGVGKIILIVVLVLFVIGAICCGAMWFMGGRYAAAILKANISMAQAVQTDIGPGSTAVTIPDEDGHFMILVGLKGELTPETIAKAQDAGWKAYVKAVDREGFDVRKIGVGRPGGGGQGGIVGWRDNVATAEEVAARTGVPAPPNAEWLDKIDPSKIKVEQGAGGGDDEEDDGK